MSLKLNHHVRAIQATAPADPQTPEEAAKLLRDPDQKHIFLYYWRIYAPKTLHHIWVTEFQFAGSLDFKPREFQFDWCSQKHMIGVEIDGGQRKAGGGRHGSDGDREKLNYAAACGYRVFRFSPAMLANDPETCIKLVLLAIPRKGA